MLLKTQRINVERLRKTNAVFTVFTQKKRLKFDNKIITRSFTVQTLFQTMTLETHIYLTELSILSL